VRSRFYILLIVVVAVCALLLFQRRHPATTPTDVFVTNGPTAGNSAPPPPTATTTVIPPGPVATNVVAQRPTQGQPGKDQAVQTAIQEENQKSLDLYGKVVDQYGTPVVGAKVRGSIGINVSMVESGGEVRYTQTDAQGCFNFTGIQGAGIGIWPQKEGYFYNLKIPWQRPVDYQPDPNNPLVFTMWRIKGNEQLANTSITADLPNDGSSVVFDSNTGNRSETGDLKITFERTPKDMRTGLVHPFDWQFKIELMNGGLIQENDYYPYWSPDNGYQPSFNVAFSANSVPWQNQFGQNFYIKNSTGKYGLMSLTVYSASTPPQAQINITFNPSGSQNLEPDFSKQ
jgi:hypothetical protein